jgi:uncharacterized protein (DUF58 family)
MNRSTFLSILVLGVLIFGLSILNGKIVALAIPFILYLMSAVVYRPHEIQLKANRIISDDQIAQDAPVVVKLSIVNEGPEIEELLIEDIVPSSLVVIKGTPRVFTTLQSGGTVELEYAIRGKRGGFEFDRVQVRASDHLDIFRQHRNLSAPAGLLILPEVSRLGRVAIRPFRTRFYAGLNPSRQGGSGTDFFGVRVYRSGDPLHGINWRLSTRHPLSMFTNEFESERIADVGLILDARARNDVHMEADSLFSHAVRATASLAEAFLNDGNRVSLLIYGGMLQRTFPGYGRLQRERVLCALAQAQTGDSEVFKSLNYFPTRFFPAKSQLVFISSLSLDDLSTFLRLRALGYHVLVISPDPVAFEKAHLKSQPEVLLAARIARVERTLLLNRLRRLGVIVVDWQVNKPLDQTLFASLHRLPHWFYAMEVMV